MDSQPKLSEILNSEEIYIIFGGPSLRNFDFDRLKGKPTLACNKSAEVYPADCVISVDPVYINTRCKFLANYPGYVAIGYRETQNGTIQKPNSDVINKIQPDYLYWFDKRFPDKMSLKDGILHGLNTGHAAVNFAMLQGFKTIHALGLDLNVMGHWHSGYSHSNQYKELLLNWAAFLDLCKKQLDECGVRLVNYNNNSAVREYEFRELSEI